MNMDRQQTFPIYRRWGLVLAIALLLASTGCRAAFVPLNREQAQSGIETQPQEAALLRVATCWAGLPLAEQAAAALTEGNPSLSIDIIPTNSATAEELVREGQADVALVVEDLGNNVQQRNLDQRYSPLRSRLLALDAVAIVVPKDAPLTGLNQEQITELFTGRVVDWRELNAGSGQPEIVVPQTATVGRALFEHAFLSEQPLTTAALLMPHDQGIVDYVAEHPNAIGYVSAAYLDDRVKAIRIDGHALTRREITSRSYPLLSSLVLLTAPQAPREATQWQAFLVTDQGRGMIERLYVPIR